MFAGRFIFYNSSERYGRAERRRPCGRRADQQRTRAREVVYFYKSTRGRRVASPSVAVAVAVADVTKLLYLLGCVCRRRCRAVRRTLKIQPCQGQARNTCVRISCVIFFYAYVLYNVSFVAVCFFFLYYTLFLLLKEAQKTRKI